MSYVFSILWLAFLGVAIYGGIKLIKAWRSNSDRRKPLKILLGGFVASFIALICIGITAPPVESVDEPEDVAIYEEYEEEIDIVEESPEPEPGPELEPEPEPELEPEEIAEVLADDPEEMEVDASETETTLEALGLEEAHVSRIIDGDTIEIATGERVRFIAIDTPERGEPGFEESTAFVRDLIQGQTVWLEADGDDTDRFGRLRRYIWVELPTDTRDESQIRIMMLNAMLLERGYAEVAIFGTPRNEALFRQIAIPLVFQQVEQPTQEDGGRIVFWTPNGQRWHSRESCSTLANSRTILSGTVEETGTRTPCQVCN